MVSDNLDGLWPQCENLFLDHYVPNFWSLDDIDLPYGRVMMIDPRDMPSMLWRCDLNKESSYDQIISDLQNIEKQHDIPVGFAFSTTWKGDIDKFKSFISDKGFKRQCGFHRLIKDIRQDNSASYQSGYMIEQTDDPRLLEEMMEVGFDKGTAEIFINGALKNLEDDWRGYFIARDPKTNEVVGCAAATHVNNLAYMSCLAVHPDHRRKSVAKDLVSARIQFLKNNNVEFITTSVYEKNEKSMAVQLKSGYELVTIDEYWTKT